MKSNMSYPKLGAGSHCIHCLAILVETTLGNCSGKLIQSFLKHSESDSKAAS